MPKNEMLWVCLRTHAYNWRFLRQLVSTEVTKYSLDGADFELVISSTFSKIRGQIEERPDAVHRNPFHWMASVKNWFKEFQRGRMLAFDKRSKNGYHGE